MSASARSVYPPSGGDLLKTAVLSLNEYKVRLGSIFDTVRTALSAN